MPSGNLELSQFYLSPFFFLKSFTSAVCVCVCESFDSKYSISFPFGAPLHHGISVLYAKDLCPFICVLCVVQEEVCIECQQNVFDLSLTHSWYMREH